MNRDMAELRVFLADLAGTGQRATRIPPALYWIAASVARGGREDVGDLVSEVVIDCLERRGQAGGVEHLLKLDDTDLLRAVRRRVLQARAMLLGDRWRLLKALRAHVRAALSSPSTPCPAAPPLSVMSGERISSARIAEAVSWYRSQPENAAACAKEIAAWIVATFLHGPTSDDLYPAASVGDHEHVEDQLDGAAVARQLPELLGPELMEIVVRRAAGEALSDIAAGVGCATSTVHGRVRAAGYRVAAAATSRGWSTTSVLLAMRSYEAMKSST